MKRFFATVVVDDQKEFTLLPRFFCQQYDVNNMKNEVLRLLFDRSVAGRSPLCDKVATPFKAKSLLEGLSLSTTRTRPKPQSRPP